ncbi:lipase 3-like [Chrysoperla carnea]|uniref:lipase 3-like n=1 Tax=Chrysoperla carnea TaxID=189513 RepID=UPI001D098744|nr:lipase 3-like [Chrysoperla carnea]
MITKTIFLILFIIGTFGYDERNSEIKNSVDLNGMLDNYYSWNDPAKIIKLAKIFNQWKFNPNELGLDQLEHVKNNGYPAENHIVKTEDGYLLTLLRIPRGINQEKIEGNRPVVYLQPGLLSTAGAYIDTGSKRALAFLLADLGFDVWIANPRGTTYSRNHTTYNSLKDKKYWQFSWHEVGSIDIPNTIDYILAKTGQKQINYIGHSQGTTTLFVMLSEKPEYNEKVKVALALAPVAFMENASPDNKTFSMLNFVKFAKPVAVYLKARKIYDLLPHNGDMVSNITKRCNYNTTDDLNFCENLWNSFDSFNPEQNDARDLGVMLTHCPGGCSVNQLLHYTQQIEKGGFKKFDFGKRYNKQIYGQTTPPAYNLSNIKAPVYLLYGDADNLATPEDVKILHNLLPNSTLFRVNYPKFKHTDFLYAKDVISLLYNYF